MAVKFVAAKSLAQKNSPVELGHEVAADLNRTGEPIKILAAVS